MSSYKTQLTGTTPFVNYQFRVKANNQQGAGEWSMTHGDLGPSPDVQFNYTEAVGGSKSIVTNYNGTGEVWAVHRITTDNDTFTVKTLVDPFDYMLAGAGGGRLDRGGTGGQWKEFKAVAIQPGDYNVRVGRVVNDRPSGSTSFNGQTCSSAGQNYGKGKASSITGAQVFYCGHGTGCCGGNVVDGCGNCQGTGNNVCCGHGKDQGGGWGGCCGGGDGYGCGYAGGARSSGSGGGSGGGVCGSWGNGAGGVVIVAYKCDPSLATRRSADVWDDARFAEWRERYDAGLVNDLDEPIEQPRPGPAFSGDEELDSAVEDAFDE